MSGMLFGRFHESRRTCSKSVRFEIDALFINKRINAGSSMIERGMMSFHWRPASRTNNIPEHGYEGESPTSNKRQYAIHHAIPLQSKFSSGQRFLGMGTKGENKQEGIQ
jgi:hypothetical protein